MTAIGEKKGNLPNSFQVIFQLSAVSRFSRDHMLKQENVLEHVGFVCIYSMLLAERMRQSGYEIDMRRLMGAVAFHDIEEGITGDVPRVTKYFDHGMRESFKRMEHAVIDRLDKWLGIKISGFWINSKKDLEGQILRIADIAAVVFKNWVEVTELGNSSFMRVAKETRDVMIAMKSEEFCTLLQDEFARLLELNRAVVGGYVKSEDMFKEMRDKK